MTTLMRLHQDERSELYQVQKDNERIGQLFVNFSHDYLYLDGYLYLYVGENLEPEAADDLADDVIVKYLNYHCPMDYGEEYTAFEVNLIQKGENYLVELDEDYLYNDNDYVEENNKETTEIYSSE